jgi:hypothetical protein
VLSWFPKSFATRSDFLLLLLPVYGSLIDTTNADRYRCRLFIEFASYISYYRGKYIVYAAGWVFFVLLLVYTHEKSSLLGQLVHLFHGLVVTMYYLVTIIYCNVLVI